MGTNEPDAGPVAKLVLLQQACCDPRCQGSHRGVLAVILDACFDKRNCFIGPTMIGRIAQLNPRTVRECLRDLELWGYLSTKPRTKRSTWYSPNFPHADQTGCLVEWGDSGQPIRVHRPAMKSPSKALEAGPQTRACGSAGPPMRVHRPEEAVELNHSKKAVEVLPSEEELEQKRRQERTAIRAEYLEAREKQLVRHIHFMETMPQFREAIADLIPTQEPES